MQCMHKTITTTKINTMVVIKIVMLCGVVNAERKYNKNSTKNRDISSNSCFHSVTTTLSSSSKASESESEVEIWSQTWSIAVSLGARPSICERGSGTSWTCSAPSANVAQLSRC